MMTKPNGGTVPQAKKNEGYIRLYSSSMTVMTLALDDRTQKDVIP